MTVTVKQLVPARTLSVAQTTEYTAVNCVAIIDKATLTNESNANVLVSVHIVVAGAVPDAGVAPLYAPVPGNYRYGYQYRYWSGHLYNEIQSQD